MATKKLKSVLGAAAAELIRTTEKTKQDTQSPEPARAPRLTTSHLVDVMGGNIENLTTYDVDPVRCRLWTYHNRKYDLLDERSCAELIASIRAHGQQDPAKVRRLRDDPEHDFEVIAGARRLWVCRFLGQRYKVTVVDVSDEEAFRLSEDSNNYQDISPYERALEYKQVLAGIYGGNQSKMAAHTNKSPAQISRILALGSLPPIIFKVLADPRELSYEQGRRLHSAMRRSEAARRIEAHAETLVEAKIRGDAVLDAKSAVQALLSVGRIGSKVPARARKEAVKGRGGEVLFTVIRRPRSLQIDIPATNLTEATINAVSDYLKKISS